MDATAAGTTRSRVSPFGAAFAVLAAMLLVDAQRAVAAEVTWGANSSTAWATTTNWVGGSRPASGDVAVFDGLGSAITRGLPLSSLGSTYAIQGIVVSGSQRSFTIGSSGAIPLSLRLTGATINLVDNVILRNSGTGSLTIASNVSSTGPMALDLGGATNNVILIDNSGGITISATVTGVNRTLTLSGSGSGALTLSASNTYTGTTQLTSGILRAGNDGAFSSSLLLLAGGTLSSDSATARSFTNNVRLGGDVAFGDATGTGALSFGTVDLNGGTQTVTTAVSTTFTGAVTNGSLTKAGAATLSLTNAGNNFGTLTISAGTVSIGANTTVTGLAGSGGGLNLAAGTFTVNASADQTFGQPITGAGGLTKSGNAALVLAAANSGFSGTTRITTGVLRAGDDAAFGTGPLALDGGTITGTGATARTFSNAVTVGGNVTFGDSTGAGPLSFGSVNLGGGTRTLTTTVSTTFSGAVTNGSLTKAGAATLALTNSGNTFSTLTIDAGTVSIGANTAITGLGGSSGALNLASGILTYTSAASEAVSLPFSGSGGFTKAGVGALTLTGNSSGYAGTTTVSAGSLVANGNLGGMVAVSSGAALAGSGTVGSVTLTGAVISPGNSPGTLSLTDLSWDATSSYDWEIYDAFGMAGSTTGWDLIAGSGQLTVTGTGFTFNLISLSGTNTRGPLPAERWSPTTSGTFRIANFATISAPSGTWWTLNTGSFSPYNAALGSFTIVPSGTSLDLVYTHTPLTSYSYVGGTGNWSDAANWSLGDTPEGSAAVMFDGPGGTATNDLVSGTGPNELTSVTALTFSGSAGGYTVAGNTLTLGAGGITNESNVGQAISTTIALAAPVSVTSNVAGVALTLSGTLDTAGNALTVTGVGDTSLGVVTGTGSFTKTGSGTATLTGSLAAPSVAVNAGAVRLGGSNLLLDSGTVSVSGGTLDLQANADTVGTVSITAGTLAGSGTLTAAAYSLGGGTIAGNLGTGAATAASGSTALDGTLAGSLTLAGGTVTIGSADRIGASSAVTISSGSLGLGAFNDTVGSFTISGGVLGGSGTLTAATYALGGGTIAANLGAGAATASTGSTALDGTLAGNLTVSGGTVVLGAADRIGTSSAVTISSGSLGLGAFNDTVGSFTMSGGVLGGSGTLTAATYALGGGTISANLGAGTATASTGSTALDGTLAGNLTVSGGTVVLGAADRVGTSSAVTISSGSLGLGAFNDAVASFAITGGALGGSGTLTASTYALNGGTVSANLGGGTLTADSGAATLDGTSGANAVTIGGGSLTTGGANRLADNAAVTLSAGGLTLGGNDTVASYSQSGGTLGGVGTTLTAGTYALTGGTVNANLGGGTLTAASGNTSIAGTVATTTVTISGGTLALASPGRLSTSATVTLSAGGLTLGGNETVGTYTQSGGALTGSGTLTASSYSISGGTLSAALGSGTVTMSGGSLLGTSGQTISNAITIGTAAGVVAAPFSGSWNFTSGSAVSTVTGAGVTFGDVTATGGAPNINASQPSGGYTLASGGTASGGNNVQFTAATGTLSASSAYVGFAVTGTGGTTFVVQSVQLGSRSTASGPQSLVLQSSADGFGSNLATASVSANSTWAASNLLPTGTATSDSLAFRLYGAGGAGSAGAGNWRVDDLYVSGTTFTTNVQSGSGTLGIAQAGAVTYSGAIAINNVATFHAAAGGTATFSGAISGSAGAITKTGAGVVALSGSSSYGGATVVAEGILEVSAGGRLAGTSGVTVDDSALLRVLGDIGMLDSITPLTIAGVLSGNGRVHGTVGGSGSIDPGNSPGILTLTQVDPAGGLDHNFEFTALEPVYTNSGTGALNDVLHLTGTVPFTAALSGSAGNSVNVFFNSDAFAENNTFVGGFFVDNATSLEDFLADVLDAQFNYYVASAGGGTTYQGVQYRTLADWNTLNDQILRITVGGLAVTDAAFETGTVSGYVTTFAVVPEPSSVALAGIGLLAAGWATRCRRRGRTCPAHANLARSSHPPHTNLV